MLPADPGKEIIGVDPDPQTQLSPSESIIPNQYVVTLRQDTSESSMQSLINQVQDKGAQIIGIYEKALTGFSFVTSDAKIANDIISFLRDTPQVESVIPDRKLSIQSSGLPN